MDKVGNTEANYPTTTCGAAIKTAADKSTVNSENMMRQTLSKTMAANFQSLSKAPDWA